MTAPQHERTRARREALQVMYQSEITGAPLSDLLEGSGDETMLLIPERPDGVEDNDLIGVPLVGYAEELLTGTLEHLDEIDDWIDETAENWAIDRLPIVDKNIIRIAAFEIAFRDDIPTGVAINEAVETAKAFGGDESPKFVNGVLGKIAQRLEREHPADFEGSSSSVNAVSADVPAGDGAAGRVGK